MECKFDYLVKRVGAPLELIDTLWNVNKEIFADAVSSSRINRYIMECKSFSLLDNSGRPLSN